VNQTQQTALLDSLTSAVEDLESLAEQLRREVDEFLLDYPKLRARTAFSIDEVSLALGVSRSTLKRRLADGTIPSVKIGRRRLVRADDLRRAQGLAA
jgi:excisionase family DNA binding protein